MTDEDTANIVIAALDAHLNCDACGPKTGNQQLVIWNIIKDLKNSPRGLC